MRAVLIAVLVVLACTLTVSASSADWSAPEALWSSDLSASELEARHTEFLMDLTAASSSGAASSSSSSSSSSTAGVMSGTPVVVNFALACGENCSVTPASLSNMASSVIGFPDTTDYPGEAFNTNFTVVTVSSSSSSSTGAGRRLLQSGNQQTNAVVSFTPSTVDNGVHAQKCYAAFVALLGCGTDQTCLNNAKSTYNLPGDVSSSTGLAATLAALVVPGSVAVNQDALTAGQQAAADANAGNREVAPVGGWRKTNIGYYVLGAVALAFAVAALIYFFVHRRPAAHATVIKENRASAAAEEARMAPVVAAPVAATGVQYTPEVEEPAAGYQQQDYKSVFALKHNVLEQKAAEEEDHNHNDVHFILHQ